MIENVVNTILCTQCGGEIHPDEGQIFITCSFCDSTIYVDKGKVVFHWYIDPTINPDQVNSRNAV